VCWCAIGVHVGQSPYVGLKVRIQIPNIPLLLGTGRILLLAVNDLPLAWQRTLHKGALLLVELAQHTEHGALVDYAAALPPAAGVTRPLSPCSNVGNWTDCGRHRLARDVVLFAGGRLVLLLGAGSGDGNGSRARHGGLYSHGCRHIAGGQTGGLVRVR
jgi:hypothetical protein